MMKMFENELFINLIAVLFTAYLIVILDTLRSLKHNRKLKESFKLITNGIKDDTIKTKDDIFLIYKTITSNLIFADFLEKYIIYIRKTKEEQDAAEIKVDANFFNRTNNFIKEIIDEERQDKPFEGVDNYEQRLLNLIDNAAKCGEKESAHNNLADLAISIKNNQAKLKKATRLNAWSIPISIVSIIITICIWWFGRTSISTQDLKVIKQDDKKTLIELIDSLNHIQYKNDSQQH